MMAEGNKYGVPDKVGDTGTNKRPAGSDRVGIGQTMMAGIRSEYAQKMKEEENKKKEEKKSRAAEIKKRFILAGEFFETLILAEDDVLGLTERDERLTLGMLTNIEQILGIKI